jgi:hypothetical protein
MFSHFGMLNQEKSGNPGHKTFFSGVAEIFIFGGGQNPADIKRHEHKR